MGKFEVKEIKIEKIFVYISGFQRGVRKKYWGVRKMIYNYEQARLFIIMNKKHNYNSWELLNILDGPWTKKLGNAGLNDIAWFRFSAKVS